MHSQHCLDSVHTNSSREFIRHPVHRALTLSGSMPFLPALARTRIVPGSTQTPLRLNNDQASNTTGNGDPSVGCPPSCIYRQLVPKLKVSLHGDGLRLSRREGVPHPRTKCITAKKGCSKAKENKSVRTKGGRRGGASYLVIGRGLRAGCFHVSCD